YLRQDPAVDLGELKDLLDGEARPKGVTQKEDALGVGNTQPLHDELSGENVAVAIHFLADAPGLAVPTQPVAADLQRAQRLLQRLLKRAANGHRLADAFHLGIKRRVGLGKFLEGKTRDFSDNVV